MIKFSSLIKWNENDIFIKNVENFLNTQDLIIMPKCAPHQKAIYHTEYMNALNNDSLHNSKDDVNNLINKLNHLDILAVYKSYKKSSFSEVQRRIIVDFVYCLPETKTKIIESIMFYNMSLYTMFDEIYNKLQGRQYSINNINKRDLCRFRAWIEVYDKENSTADNIKTKKQMFYAVESANATTLCDRMLGSPIPFDEIFNFPNVVMMQSCGLRDSNNRMIFENDVLEINIENNIVRCVVKYGLYTDPNGNKNIGWRLLFIENDKIYDYFYSSISYLISESVSFDGKITILGNIYETEEFKHLQNIESFIKII